MSPTGAHKSLLKPLRAAMADFDAPGVQNALDKVFAPDAVIRLGHPIGDLTGADDFYKKAYAPLLAAIPDLERREFICISGTTPEGQDWVGFAGHYLGTFAAHWLDIPPSGHFVHMRFHEFYRIENNRVVEVQALWDIPEVMMQSGVWPMAPALGRTLFTPAPATQDGLIAHTNGQGEKSVQTVIDMLTAMTKHPSQGGPEVMEMERFWDPRMSWYGPAGIGTCRGIEGFRNWHQIPFLAAMPDRGQNPSGLKFHFFGEGPYVGVTGWPNMRQTLSHGGWLGLPATNTVVTLRSLDFWRLERGKIRENWVLVDLLDLYAQLGIDVLTRMHALAAPRQNGVAA